MTMKSVNPLNILKLLGILLATPVVLGLLLLCYTFLGTITGFFEWKDAYNVRHYQLPTGTTLQSTVEARLRSHGISKNIVWSAACYGPSAIVTACTTSDSYQWGNCLGFDYYHGDEVLSANRLAHEIVPELKQGSGHYGIALDNAKLDNLR